VLLRLRHYGARTGLLRPVFRHTRYSYHHLVLPMTTCVCCLHQTCHCEINVAACNRFPLNVALHVLLLAYLLARTHIAVHVSIWGPSQLTGPIAFSGLTPTCTQVLHAPQHIYKLAQRALVVPYLAPSLSYVFEVGLR
jgi:hypothetical protein